MSVGSAVFGRASRWGGHLISRATTGPLRSAISDSIPARPFNIEFWDGESLPATLPGPAATLRFAGPSALGHIIRSPGALGIFRGYVDGSLQIDDLKGFSDTVGDWTPPTLGTKERVTLALAAGLAAAPAGIPKTPSLELKLTGERHSKQRDAAAVKYHYDVGNEFFALTAGSVVGGHGSATVPSPMRLTTYSAVA